MKIEYILQECDISEENSRAIAQDFQTISFKAGENIFTKGDESDSFYIIKSGELMGIGHDINNKETVFDILGPDQIFGDITLLKGIKRTLTIRALSNAQVYKITKEKFFFLFEENKFFQKFIQKRELLVVPAFTHLKHSELLELNKHFTKKTLKAGEVITREGDKADKLFIISKGTANNSRIDNEGTQIDMGTIKSMNASSYKEFLKEKKYSSTLTMADDGEILSIDRKTLIDVAKKNPNIAVALPMKKSILATIAPFFYSKAAYLSIPFVSMNKPKLITKSILVLMLMLMIPAILPSIWPQQFPYLQGLKIDTDPENMLPEDAPSRVFHNKMKEEMNLHDIMVVGVVNNKNENGIYNPSSLKRIHELTEFAKTQHWKSHDEGKLEGVIEVDIMAPSTVDDISQAGPGSISFSWLMKEAPTNQVDALALRDKIKRLPLMNETLASIDNTTIALYLPLSSKDVSYQVYTQLKEKIATFKEGDEEYYIAGLPVAEDLFGVEMFIQMAVSAPMAMVVIFLLMYIFFRNLTLITAPMIVAMVSVMITMSLLVVTGQTVHIMSSMIAIFIMPIAVLDSVHILSEFFDYYPRIKSRRLTMEHVVRELYTPMLLTSITTALGFASLALVPIPPIQVFGIFVSIGVIVAWLLSMSFIPAYIFLVPKEKIDALAVRASEIEERKKIAHETTTPLFSRILQGLRKLTLKYAKAIVIISLLMVSVFIYGITKIVVNDNPVRWFQTGHEISVADKTLNSHLAGTYMAYIAFKSNDKDQVKKLVQDKEIWREQLVSLREEYPLENALLFNALLLDDDSINNSIEWMNHQETLLEDALDSDELTEEIELFAEEALSLLDEKKSSYEEFKNPELLNYISNFQAELLKLEVVGKTTSIADFIKTVNRELHSADEAHYKIPVTSQAVAQSLLTYQNSHRPQDIYRFVTKDYRQGIVWLMLNSGDNVDMTKVVEFAEEYVRQNPPPVELEMNWFGLNYINTIWQEEMVSGMMVSIISSYFTVFLIMVFLFRSIFWGTMAMIPLTLTLLVIYGVLGLIGKSYDMPVAVLSALSIGLAVDFSIHFLTRIRHLQSQTENWNESLRLYFNEPAQAIVRNMLVVAIGFTPLLFAPLVPYNTVGVLIGSILLTSGLATLVIIPALLKLGVFNQSRKVTH